MRRAAREARGPYAVGVAPGARGGAPRPRHRRKDLEAVLREAEDKGWRVQKGKRYFTMWCPNDCRCFKTVHLTPSDPYYERNLRAQLRRGTCWDGEGGRP